MEQVLAFARGPLFAGSLAILVLGLMRVAFIMVWGMLQPDSEADQSKTIPRKSEGWLAPLKHLPHSKMRFGILVILLLGTVAVPLFQINHLLMWRQLGLPVVLFFPELLADLLTALTVAAGIILLYDRIIHKNTRLIKTDMDYVLLLLIEAIFITGFIASRPWSPMSYDAAMLIHALCGNVLMVLIPFSSMAHFLLFPLIRLAAGAVERFSIRLNGDEAKGLEGKEANQA